MTSLDGSSIHDPKPPLTDYSTKELSTEIARRALAERQLALRSRSVPQLESDRTVRVLIAKNVNHSMDASSMTLGDVYLQQVLSHDDYVALEEKIVQLILETIAPKEPEP